MKIFKLSAQDAEKTVQSLKDISQIPFTDKKVQGANIFQQASVLYAVSPKRYKLFTNGLDIIYFFDGVGHFKWARGEINFQKGDCFQVESVGEYDVNGNCSFAVTRS